MALPTLAPSDPTESEPSGRPQPKREHILLAAVGVVALLAGGWFFFLRSSGSSTPPAPVLHKPVVRVTGAAGAAGAAAAAKPATGTKPVTAGKPAAGTAPAAATSAPVSELAAYVAKANAVCAVANANDKAIPSPDDTVKGRIAYVDRTLPIRTSEVRQLRALAVPAGHPEFAKMWDQAAQINTLAHQYRGALNDGNPNTATQLLAWSLQDNKTLDAQLTTAGLTSCLSNA